MMEFWKSLGTFEKVLLGTLAVVFVLALNPSCSLHIDSKPSGTEQELADLNLVNTIRKFDKICTDLCGAPPSEFGIEPGKEECFCTDGRTLDASSH